MSNGVDPDAVRVADSERLGGADRDVFRLVCLLGDFSGDISALFFLVFMCILLGLQRIGFTLSIMTLKGGVSCSLLPELKDRHHRTCSASFHAHEVYLPRTLLSFPIPCKSTLGIG